MTSRYIGVYNTFVSSTFFAYNTYYDFKITRDTSNKFTCYYRLTGTSTWLMVLTSSGANPFSLSGGIYGINILNFLISSGGSINRILITQGIIV